ncbi:MAG: AsmA family protein, partial [Smithella sp.]
SQIKPDVASAFLPEGMALGGNLAMLLNVDKKPEKESPLNFNGNVKMAKVSCAYKNVHLVLDGAVKLTPEIISLEGLQLIAGSNRADILGSVRNYKEYPDVNVSIKSNYIALDELFVPVPASDKSQETKGADVRKEPEPMNLKLKVNASMDIGKTVYKGISINNFTSRYELKNNVFSIPYLKGNTLNGAFAIKGAVDLAQKGTRYNMTADLNNVKIEEIINAFAPKARDKLFGILSGTAAINGGGTVPANLKRNLKGKGEFTVKNGVLKNSQLSAGLLAILGLKDMKEIPIDKANSQFNIADEIVNLTTNITSKDMIIDETGTIGMDTKLDLGILAKVSDRLAPKLISQSSIASFLSSEKGWTGIPLRVGGTISKPSYGIDTRVVGRKVKESVQKKVGEELQKILQKDKTKSSSTEQKKSSSPADRLRELLDR